MFISDLMCYHFLCIIENVTGYLYANYMGKLKIYTYIYIYTYIHVCVCVWIKKINFIKQDPSTFKSTF